jgi:glycogen operon protein
MRVFFWCATLVTLLSTQCAEASINRLKLGSQLTSKALTFRVYSSRATRIEVDLFAAPFAADEVARVALNPDPSTSVWSVSVPLSTVRGQYGISGTIYYGYRAWGPNWTFDSAWTKGSGNGFVSDVDGAGNRFNPNKLLLDPYAREISHDPENPRNLDGTVFASGPKYRLLDSGQMAPKGIVLADLATNAGHLTTPLKDDIIYEVNLRGLTEADTSIPQNLRGTYAGAAMKVNYLKTLGITAVEFLPLQEFENDINDVQPASADYWGYMTLNYFAPDRRYSSDKSPGGPSRELRKMIQAFHAAKLKVFVDVVYNHTGEGYAWDPADTSTYNILSWRGLDNPSYYLLTSDHQFSYDNTGVGGDYNTANTVAQDLIVDSLAYWHDALGADGFRFDLAPVLGNTCTEGCFNYDKMAASTATNRLAREFPGVALIAEPWAPGGGVYELGDFPSGWSDWNDKFRDLMRTSQNKLGMTSFTTGDLATRFAGSSDLFQNNGRLPWNSINFIDVHDGLTLADVYRFNDGDDSWDQGGNHDAQIQAARTGLALVLLSAGTPMIAGGDEFLRSQNGNSNAYNIDSALNWLNYSWSAEQTAFQAYARSVIAFRLKHVALRPAGFYTPQQVVWYQPSGTLADTGYFGDPDNHAIGWWMDGGALGDSAPALFIGYNAWSGSVTFQLPSPPAGKSWLRVIDSGSGDPNPAPVGQQYNSGARSVFAAIAQ